MRHPICSTCGVQYPAAAAPPPHCLICEDERQYVGLSGQQWTTLEDLRTGHHNELRPEEARLTSLHTEPKLGIGQRAFLLRAPGGNVLWDCLTLLDEGTVAAIQELGGLAAIAIS